LLSRPIDPREHEELDGYRKLHGACTGFVVKEARSPTDATFAMTCERGRFELGANLAGGKIVGFAIHDQIKQSSTFIGDDAGTCKPRRDRARGPRLGLRLFIRHRRIAKHTPTNPHSPKARRFSTTPWQEITVIEFLLPAAVRCDR
jgi:hypothetical protein